MNLSEQMRKRTCEAVYKENHDWGLLHDQILDEIIIGIKKAADEGNYSYGSIHEFPILRRVHDTTLGVHIAKYLTNYFINHGFSPVSVTYGTEYKNLYVNISW